MKRKIKNENAVQHCTEILKYYARESLVKIEVQEKKSLQELKYSFQQSLVLYLQKYPLVSQEHIRGLQLWKKGSRFLNSQIASALEKGFGDIVGDGIKWEEPVTKKSRIRKSEKMETLDFGQKYALVQKGVEGNFFFTSPVSRLINDYNVDTNAAKIKIEATRSLKQDQVATLGSVAGSAVKLGPGRKVKKGVRIYSADFPEYGAFHSFAPSVDLGRSNLSRIESIAIRFPGRKVFIENGLIEPTYPLNIYNGGIDSSLPKLVSLPNDDELENLKKASEEVDFEFIKEFGVDLDFMFDSKEEMDIELDDSALFARNVTLIKKLIDFQDERFRKGSENVSEAEMETAKSLKENLSKLVSSFTPKDLVTTEQIRQAMIYVNKTEKAFRGGLSQQSPFVFPCNTAGNGVIPPGSGTVPLALLRDGRKND